jgi:hypothetical protein
MLLRSRDVLVLDQTDEAGNTLVNGPVQFIDFLSTVSGGKHCQQNNVNVITSHGQCAIVGEGRVGSTYTMGHDQIASEPLISGETGRDHHRRHEWGRCEQ